MDYVVNIDDAIVKKVDFNFLIDYLKVSYSEYLAFSKYEILDFISASQSEDENIIFNAREKFLKIIKRSSFYVGLFKILKVKEESIYFWRGSSAFKFGIVVDDYFHISFLGPINRFNRHVSLLEFKGSSCRYFEKLCCSWSDLFFHFIDYLEFSVTRLDLALDDFVNTFEIITLKEKLERGEYVCSARSIQYIVSYCSRLLEGETLQIGSHDSNKILQIYNKNLERLKEGFTPEVTYWIRYEFRLFGDIAKSAFVEIYNSGFKLNEYIPDAILGFLEFKENNNFAANYRNQTWSPWLEFLNTTKKHKIINQFLLEETLMRKKDWVKNSTFRSLMYTAYLMGTDFIDFVEEGIREKFKNINTKELNVINRFNVENGLLPLKIEDLRNIGLEFEKNFTNKKMNFKKTIREE